MEPSRGDSRYNLNYSMSSIGLTLADQADMYGNPTTLSGRPPSAGILQSMGGVGGISSGGLLSRSAGNLISNTQCQSVGNSSQQRGLKRAGSDCYDDSHQRVGAGGITIQGLDNCGAPSNVQHSSQQQPQTSSAGMQDVVDDSYNNLQSKKSPPANGKKTKGRVKIKMEYIDNKLRRYTTFSKRKTGIMKKAYELSTLTGTQVMLLVASETGHVYTFATRKLQPMITSEAGKQLIQTCLNSPDPPSLGGGDQRMSATGFEETELSYNIADEDSKEVRSPSSSVNDSEDSSDNEGIGNGNSKDCINTENSQTENAIDVDSNNCRTIFNDKKEKPKGILSDLNFEQQREKTKNEFNSPENGHHSSGLTNVPQNVLLQLIEAGHLEVHNEEDGSGHQYVAIPLPSSCAEGLEIGPARESNKLRNKTAPATHLQLQKEVQSELIIKQEH